MKNKKLNLDELKVKSFVTDLDGEKANTAKGGAPTDICMSDGGCLGTGGDSEEREKFSVPPVCPSYPVSGCC